MNFTVLKKSINQITDDIYSLAVAIHLDKNAMRSKQNIRRLINRLKDTVEELEATSGK